MQLIGHCRFSWLGISDTGRELLNLDEPAKMLWDPRRMAVRFHLFETLLLPSLLAQTDRNFRLILTTSKAMPQIYFDRLLSLIEGLPMFEINATESGDIGAALSPIVAQSIEEHQTPVHFRVDDDDGLAAQYIEKLRGAASQHNFNPGTAITFPKGVIGFYDGTRMRNAISYKMYIAIGLAFVLGASYRTDPFRVQHRKVGERNASYVDPTFCAYHYTRHSANNTYGYGDAVNAIDIDHQAVARLIRNHPELAEGKDVTAGIDDQIAQAFPFSDGAKLRADLARHAQYNELAEEMGFLG